MAKTFTSVVAKQLLATLQCSVRCQTRVLSTGLAGCREKKLKLQSKTPLCNSKNIHTAVTDLGRGNREKSYSTAVDVQSTDNEVAEIDKSLVQLVNEKIKSDDLGRLFAVVQICAKQRKVTTEDIIVVEGDFAPTVGDRIRLEKVLLVGGKDFTLTGRPVLSRKVVNVEATVVEKTMSHFRSRFYYIKARRFQRFKLFRDPQTVLVINCIELNQID